MKKALLAAISLFAMVMVYGETTWLRVTKDGKTKDMSVTRAETEQNGLRTIVEKSERGTSTCVLQANGEAVRYELADNNGSSVMVRNGSVVKVTGMRKGKKVDADVNLGKADWYGSFEYGLRRMCATGEKELVAMLINPGDPSKAIEMKYTLIGEEKIGGTNAHKIKIGLTGMLANFWSAYYWVNDKGDTIRYEGDEGPGTGKITVEYLRTE